MNWRQNSSLLNIIKDTTKCGIYAHYLVCVPNNKYLHYEWWDTSGRSIIILDLST